MRASLSAVVVGVYAAMVLLLIFVIGARSSIGFSWVLYLLLAVTFLFLARYLSTTYLLDDATLVARTLFGARRVPLEEVRAIEYASLRDLAPTGGGVFSWIWRGKMYSAAIGEFDPIFTDAASGLLVTAGAYPLYISPRRPQEFARELSRRVRSYTGALQKDVGNPSAPEPPRRTPGRWGPGP
ncbi:MAG TPA: PH domain-containing protein [Thermoplasmata archaeon]|nr:PH domain-containing protein [Thermoplasmata archaeon]